jgi:hypothetical protein
MGVFPFTSAPRSAELVAGSGKALLTLDGTPVNSRSEFPFSIFQNAHIVFFLKFFGRRPGCPDIVRLIEGFPLYLTYSYFVPMIKLV